MSRVRQVLGRPVSLLVLAVIGFLFAVAYRETMAEEPSRATARAGLIAEIKGREAATDRLTERAEQLREEVGRQRDAALSGSQASRLRTLEAGTGLARVRGDGVVVRLADATADQDGGDQRGRGPVPGAVLGSAEGGQRVVGGGRRGGGGERPAVDRDVDDPVGG